jgi:tripartite-type tricarboxylate transporter receptor subunit TctC
MGLKASRVLAPAGFLFFLAAPVFSQTPYYKGKTITLIQSSGAGDTSDTMVRATMPALKKHIPGEPAILFEYMPGGGGTKAANHIFKNVRPDGLTIGRIGGGLVANAVLKEPGVLYDLNKFIYLGSAHSTYHWVFLTRRDAGFRSLEALRSASGVRIGAQAVGHSNYFVGRLFTYLLGLKDPKFVVGYSGTEQDIALMRGELDGRINNADTLQHRNAEMLNKGLIDVHAIMEVPKGLKQPGFERLPEIEDFTRTEKERRLLGMVRSFRQVGSPYILPPGTPREQVKILQEAWAKTFKDPEFYKEYKKMVGEEPTPIMPEEMEKLVRELPRDPELIELFKKINAAGPLPPRQP